MAAEKNMIQTGYDEIAEKYLEWAVQHPSARLQYTDELLKNLSGESHCLELGCGAGVPVLEKLIAHGSTVTGNDISAKQLELAKIRFPRASFVHGDMTALEFQPSSFDAVLAFYAIIHLPRAEQPAMLSLIYRWLKPGGYLALNFATQDEAGIYQNFFGARMFWSSYDVETSKRMITDAGFTLRQAEVLGSGETLDRSDPDYGIEFLWVFAQKPIS